MRCLAIVLTALPLVTLCLAACGAPLEDEALSDESEIKKKTKPKAGMGAVDVEKPAWYDPAVFKGAVQIWSMGTLPMTSLDVAMGARKDLAAGRYQVFFKPEGMSTEFATSSGGRLEVIGHLWRGGTDLAVGDVWQVKPAGLQLELDRPLVWPTRIEIGSVTVPAPGIVTMQASSGLRPHTDVQFAHVALNSIAIAPGEKIVGRLLPAETYSLSGLVGQQSVTLQEGKLTKVPVKTVKFAVDLDTIDPLFPDPSPRCVTMEASSFAEPVRGLDKFNAAVLPENMNVTVTAYGLKVPSKATAGIRRFILNRLELDDLEVAAAGGVSQRVRGTAVVEAKVGTTWTRLGCATAFPIKTGSGLDLPDGTYRVTSTATGPSGTVSHVEEISFP